MCGEYSPQNSTFFISTAPDSRYLCIAIHQIGKDVRTILNIENYKGNPKLEVLYPLIRAMNIDAREVFYPELERESPAIRQLRLLVEECSEAEAAALIPVFQSVLSAMRSQDGTNI